MCDIFSFVGKHGCGCKIGSLNFAYKTSWARAIQPADPARQAGQAELAGLGGAGTAKRGLAGQRTVLLDATDGSTVAVQMPRVTEREFKFKTKRVVGRGLSFWSGFKDDNDQVSPFHALPGAHGG